MIMVTLSMTMLGFSVERYFFNGISAVTLISLKIDNNVIVLNNEEAQSYQNFFLTIQVVFM